MKNVFKALCVGIITAILVALIPFEGECREISEQVFRIHILANSDSADDQALKLKVRDAVIKKSEELFASAQNKSDAMKLAQENIDLLTRTAQEVVYSEDYTYPVTASVKTMYFNTRYYDNITMPSGIYDALQIRIGEAKGKNWWCVMYPSLCISSASKNVTLEEELTPSQFSIVSSDGKYQFRFKIIEVFYSFLDYFTKE